MYTLHLLPQLVPIEYYRKKLLTYLRCRVKTELRSFKCPALLKWYLLLNRRKHSHHRRRLELQSSHVNIPFDEITVYTTVYYALRAFTMQGFAARSEADQRLMREIFADVTRDALLHAAKDGQGWREVDFVGLTPAHDDSLRRRSGIFDFRNVGFLKEFIDWKSIFLGYVFRAGSAAWADQ